MNKAKGFFGEYGGQFIPESLLPIVNAIDQAFERYKDDPEFNAEIDACFRHYSGRPTPVYFCANLTKELGGARIYLKREDLNHLGAHKINNTIGQTLLARRMGKKRIIAETGAGQHGVATAATAALLNMDCTIYMGEEDIRRQKHNVFRMKMMGARVQPVTRGQKTLKEAVDEAFEALLADPEETFYVIGSAVGPHPYPTMVRHFQSVIGTEARKQMLESAGRLPDYVLACVGGGSNAIGIFSAFLKDREVRLQGIEPAGRGLTPGQHAASLSLGTPGILHGFRSYLLQDEAGEAADVYSISAGLDYPGVGPEHSALKDEGRAQYVTIGDTEAIEALMRLSRAEGIIPALESAHALAQAIKIAPTLDADKIILVNLSGRGDKDMAQIQEVIHF